MKGLSDYPEIWHTNESNFQCTSLLLSNVVMVQSKQDNQGYKEMKGHLLWLQLTSDQKNIESRQKQQKPLVYHSFYASKLLDYLLDFVMQGHNFTNTMHSWNRKDDAL